MQVDNIFKLINKYRAEEDQLSAGFGFILQNNRKILDTFLRKLGIRLSAKELKQVDIETQVSYDFGSSRIDLQLTIYNNFLVFLESKFGFWVCKDRLREFHSKFHIWSVCFVLTFHYSLETFFHPCYNSF